jgi:hypothetical protein
MIGKRDDRRKEDAVKKAELEAKKKKEEAVREVYVAVSGSTTDAVLANMLLLQTPDAVLHVFPAQHSFGSCEYTFSEISGGRHANLDVSIALPGPRGMSGHGSSTISSSDWVRIPTSSRGQ